MNAREGWDEAFKAASTGEESDVEDIPMEYFENSKSGEKAWHIHFRC